MSEHIKGDVPQHIAQAMMDRVSDLNENISELRQLLNYVYYARLPGGNKVEEYIPLEYAKRVVEILEKTKRFQ